MFFRNMVSMAALVICLGIASTGLAEVRYPAFAKATPATRPSTPSTRSAAFRLKVDLPLASVVAALGEGETIYDKGNRFVGRWTVNGKLTDLTFRDGKLNDWEVADDAPDGDGVAVTPGGFAPGMRVR